MLRAICGLAPQIHWHHKHPWWPLFRPPLDPAYIDETGTASVITYTSASWSRLDQWVCHAYQASGVSGTLGVTSGFADNFWVVGPLVVRFLIPNEVATDIDREFSACETIARFDPIQFAKSYFMHQSDFEVSMRVAPGLAARTLSEITGPHIKGWSPSKDYETSIIV